MNDSVNLEILKLCREQLGYPIPEVQKKIPKTDKAESGEYSLTDNVSCTPLGVFLRFSSASI